MLRLLLIVLALLAVPGVPAMAQQFDGQFTQGGLIRGAVAPGAQVWFEERPVRVADNGTFIFGFGRNFGVTAELRVRLPDGRERRQTLQVAPRVYEVQRIDGLPPKMVTPPAEVLARIRRENAAIADVRQRDSAVMGFASGFVWPVQGRVTGVFGSQRILNGKPRRPHYGIDIAAPAGTPVRAPADGEVAMAEADLYYTGGTVMLDHGHGLTSVYSHLQDVSVQVGQRLRQGEVLGTVGSTGRSTGAHLDWRLNWFKQRLDPQLLVGPMPAG